MRHPMTDLGNSCRFLDRHGERVRYSRKSGWWVHDGLRWVQSKEIALSLVIDTVRSIVNEANEEQDDDLAKKLASWAKTSQQASHIQSILPLSVGNESILVDNSDFNPDPLKFNCLNGTVDLSTGKLLPHDPKDMITNLAKFDSDPEAEAGSWTSFVKEIMKSNEVMCQSLQLICGYAMTGLTSERCIYILHGSGMNGKSVFLDTISEVLGDYSAVVPAASLTSNSPGAIPNDIAMLHDKRLVTASETEASASIAEGLVKSVTGDRKITARFLRHEYFEFSPKFTLFLATNHKPAIKGMDPAIWARIRLIPFTFTVDKENEIPDLDDMLIKEAPGIFNWMLKGCLGWLGSGKKMRLAMEITDATDQYRADQDIIQMFIDDCLTVVTGARTPKTAIYARYQKWCEDTGHRPLASNRLSHQLHERGFIDMRDKNSRFWNNIGILSESFDNNYPVPY